MMMKKQLRNVLLFIMLSMTVCSWSQVGSLDTAFDPDEGPDFYVNATLPLSNGKILIAGAFSEYNAVSRKGIARINGNGTLDASFDPGTGIPVVSGMTTTAVNHMVLQPDGKILIGGFFDTYNDIAKKNMARLDADGTVDAGFNLDARIVGTVKSILIQPDAKIIITGSFTVSGSRKGIARLNADGTLDESFNSYIVGANNRTPDFFCSLLQPDGKILVGGSSDATSTTFLKVARLNADGTRDTSFTPMIYTSTSTPVNTGGTVFSLALLPDGKIIVGGGYNQVFGTVTKNNFARLNANGTLDTAFNTGTGTGTSILSRIKSIALQSDGKMVISGEFSVYNGISRKGIARINANGTLDTSFAVGTGITSSSGQSVNLLEDGSILLAGNFTTYNNVTRNRIAKISVRTINVTSLSETGPFCAGASFDVNYAPVGTYDSGNIFTAQLSDAAGSFSSPVAIGTLASAVSGTINVAFPESTVAGTGYRIRIVSSSPAATGESNAANIVITATPIPVAAAQSFCTSATIANLQVALLENAAKKWYASATSELELAATQPLVSGNYYVTQTLNNCESGRLLVAVTINPSAIPNFAPIPAFCAESAAPLLALTSPNGITGTWNPAVVSNTESCTYIFTPDAGQCASNATLTVVVTETLPPVAVAIQDFTTGQTLANFSVAGQNIKWFDAPSGGNELPSSQVIMAGTSYYASQTVNGCESPIRSKVTAGIDLSTGTFERSQLQYYPNPVGAVLNLSYSETINSVAVYDLLGQQVLQASPNADQTEINVSGLASGTYVMKVLSGNNSKTVKIIKR